ncbi:MAG: MATE family efflux transporter [Chitinophagales bacterium]
MLSSIYKTKAKEALRLAMPIMAGQLGQVLMGVFDNIQIGALGASYIAACGFANNVYWLINLLGIGMLFSVSPLVSEAFGEKHQWKAVGVYRSAMKVAIGFSVAFTFIIWLAVRYITIFRQEPVINQLASDYLYTLNISTFALLLYSVAKQLLDGMGRTKPGMVLSLGGLLLNIFLNWVFIFGNLGAPALGIKGAAVATATSRTLMLIILLTYIRFDKQINELRLAFAQSADRARSFAMPVLKIGVPAGFQFFFEIAAFSFTQMMSGWLGVNYLASHQIAISLASTTFMVATGLSTAGTIMTGFAYGAKDKEGVRIAGNTVFLLTIAVELVFLVSFLLFHNLLPLIYTNDVAVLQIAGTLVIFAAFFQLSDGLQVTAAGALRGVQDVKVPSVIAFVSYWLIMMPTSYLLAFHTSLGINGLWLGFVIGLTVAATILYLRFRYKVQHLRFEEL